MTMTEAVMQRSVELADGGRVELWSIGEADRLSVTAWSDRGDLIGLATCALLGGEHPHEANVEVTPSDRRRGIGSALLAELIRMASTHGIGAMTWTVPADDLAARRVTTSAHAVCARKVAGGRAKSTIFVPRDLARSA